MTSTYSRCVVCNGVGARRAPSQTPEGRSRLTHREMVPHALFGRNRKTRWRHDDPIDPVFTEDPWDAEGESTLMCAECRDQLLGQPVLLAWDLALLSSLIRQAGLSEEQRTSDRSKMAGRVQLFHEVIARGLLVLTEERACPFRPSEPLNGYPFSSLWPHPGRCGE